MPSYVFPPLAIPTLSVVGSDALFPVHRVYCVGRNFADHAIEMGHDPSKEPPFFFQKNPDTLVPSGSTIAYPKATKDVHHEVELVVALGQASQRTYFVARVVRLQSRQGPSGVSYLVGCQFTGRVAL